MSNKAKYEVVFQFDYDEDNPKKFTNGRINRVMKAHDGEFVSEYCDYGIKDMSYDISSSAETLKTLMETVLKDAERSDVRMTCWAKRKMDLVIFNIADVEDKNVLFEKINEMRDSIGMRRINVSKHNEHEIAVELQNGSDKNFALDVVDDGKITFANDLRQISNYKLFIDIEDGIKNFEDVIVEINDEKERSKDA